MDALKIIKNFTNASLNIASAFGDSSDVEELRFQIPFGDHIRNLNLAPEELAYNSKSPFLESKRGRCILVHVKALLEEISDRLEKNIPEKVSGDTISDYMSSPGIEMTGGEILMAAYEVGDDYFRCVYEDNANYLLSLLEKSTRELDIPDAIRILISLFEARCVR